MAKAASGDQRFVPAFRCIAGNNQNRFCYLAFKVLLAMGIPDRDQRLEEAIHNQKLCDVAYEFLSKTPVPGLTQHLVSLLDAAIKQVGHDRVSSDLLYALAACGGPDVAKHIWPFLKANERQPSCACRALGKTKADLAIPYLLEYIQQTTDINKRGIAIQAIGNIGSEKAFVALLGLPTLTCLRMYALAKCDGMKVVKAMCEWLATEDDDLREEAVGTLGRMAVPEAVDLLVELLKDRRLDLAAGRWLMLHKDPEAWQSAIPSQSRAPQQWLATTCNFINSGGDPFHLSDEEKKIRIAALLAAAESAASKAISDSPEMVAPCIGTWLQQGRKGDPKCWHVFNPDGSWLAYDEGEQEVTIDGSWDKNSDGIQLWDNVNFSRFERDGVNASIRYTDGSFFPLTRHSDGVTCPPS